MTSKYYAIINKNKETTIVRSWAECQAKTKGISGALFKSFKTKQDAFEWINQYLKNTSLSSKLPSNTLIIYVDGSYTHSKSLYAGWGWVAIQSDTILAENYGKTKNQALSRNVDGEIVATLEALKWAKSSNITHVTIAHDYIGISAWAEGLWKTNSKIAQYYVNNLRSFLDLKIRFFKVEAHSGNVWNEKADSLAKKGLF